MTDLLKSVKRRTLNSHSFNGRRLVIEVRPGATDTVIIREERRRTGYAVPIESIYKLGARLEAERERAEKKAEKKQRKDLRK